MTRDFGYKGEMWRVAAHGIPGREEVFIVHVGRDGREEATGGHETSIDRMTEPNDTGAPLQDIIVMLCDRLIEERGMTVSDPGEPFDWRHSGIAHVVHDGVHAFARG